MLLLHVCEARNHDGPEKTVFARTREITGLLTLIVQERVAGLISETIRLNDAGDQVLGVWEPGERRIVIRRDQLIGIGSFAGALLHGMGHMVSATSDRTLGIRASAV